MSFEEQTTGCVGAGSYREFAHANGYSHVEVLNWTSSAGDWQFIVSKNGEEWFILSQSNNYPRAGFSHEISKQAYYGDKEAVFAEIELQYG